MIEGAKGIDLWLGCKWCAHLERAIDWGQKLSWPTCCGGSQTKQNEKGLGSTSKNRWLLVIVDDPVSVPPHHQLGPTVVPEVFSVQGFFSYRPCLPRQGRILCFRFITEYSSSMDFGPYVIVALFLNEDFWKMIFWLVLKLEISSRVMLSWRILVSFRGFFWKLHFLHGQIFEFP